MCKTKINYSIQKRTSTLENVYNCGNDHKCEQSRKEVKSLESKETKNTDDLILVRAIDLILEGPGSSLFTDDNSMINQTSNLITSEESMVISPDTSINISWNNSKDNSISKLASHRRHHGSVRKHKGSRKLGFGGMSTPLKELRSRDESSDS